MEGSSSQEVVSTRPSCLSHPIAVFPWKISSDHDKEKNHAFGNKNEMLFHVVSRSWTFPAECLGMLYVAALFSALGTPSAMQCEHV